MVTAMVAEGSACPETGISRNLTGLKCCGSDCCRNRWRALYAIGGRDIEKTFVGISVGVQSTINRASALQLNLCAKQPSNAMPGTHSWNLAGGNRSSEVKVATLGAHLVPRWPDTQAGDKKPLV